ncbi:hypothetical protein [Streptomyces sp. NPDC051546]|uniref:hypothetical protein n=1 Tax=Streptomyces sp. NPDC051546 TaxID=3365655 RepID=UPI0037A25662
MIAVEEHTLITPAEVCAIIGIPLPAAGTPDLVWLTQAVDAINALAVDTVPRLRTVPPLTVWPEDVRAGLLMQAQRLFARRSSPTGVAAYTDSGPAYVARWDPDVERLLRIGSWAPPQAG